MAIRAIWILLFCGVLKGVVSYPDGPPRKRCEDMMPQHGYPSRELSASPFTISTSADEYRYGTPVRVWIAAIEHFEGIMMQVRKVTMEPTPVGNWSKPLNVSETSTMDCVAQQDTIAHTGKSHKASGSMFLWWPPMKAAGSVKIVATLVREKDDFYVMQPSVETLSAHPSYTDNPWDGPFIGGQESSYVSSLFTMVFCLVVTMVAMVKM